MPMDPTFSNALHSGLSLGANIAESKARLALARDQFDRQMAFDAERAHQFDTVEARRQAHEDTLDRQRAADQAANTSLFDSLDQHPDANAVGPFDPDHPQPNVSGGLGIARDLFTQADPATQQHLLAPTLQSQRDAARTDLAARIKFQGKRMQDAQALANIEAWDGPQHIKDIARARVMTGQPIPFDHQQGEHITTDEWDTFPFTQGLDPTVADIARTYVASTGKWPTHILNKVADGAMGGAGGPSFSPSRNPAIGKTKEGVNRARSTRDAATLQFRAAMQAYNGAVTRNAQGTLPDDKLAAYETAKNAAQAKMDGATKALDQAHDAAMKAYDSPAGAGAPLDLHSAVQRAWKLLGDDADPSAVADYADKLMKGQGGKGAGGAPPRPAPTKSNPGNFHEEPGDAEPDGADDFDPSLDDEEVLNR